jgi:hypothetical protein
MGRHGLQYICDMDLCTHFPSTYGEAVDGALADIQTETSWSGGSIS